MTIVRQLLTNRAYGTRRVKPFVLACVHITGNSKTSAYSDPHKGAQGERNYANRAGSDGPSAHYYIARDGWGIEAIDATRHWAWSNGDISRPNTDNPGIRRVLALRAKGYNANEAYWLEFECVGFPRSYPITEEQVQTVGRIIGERARLSGLPINRETVHGHWEINGIDRQNCPDPNHEAFLNRVIAAAKGGATEDSVKAFKSVLTPAIGTIATGTWLYDDSDLGASSANVKVDPGRDFPYLGYLDNSRGETVRIVVNDNAVAMFTPAKNVTSIRAAVAASPAPSEPAAVPTVLTPGLYEVPKP
jgi:hypothetical protein